MILVVSAVLIDHAFSSFTIRETGELQVLSAHHQSGGVSAVSLKSESVVSLRFELVVERVNRACFIHKRIIWNKMRFFLCCQNCAQTAACYNRVTGLFLFLDVFLKYISSVKNIYITAGDALLGLRLGSFFRNVRCRQYCTLSPSKIWHTAHFVWWMRSIRVPFSYYDTLLTLLHWKKDFVDFYTFTLYDRCDQSHKSI